MNIKLEKITPDELSAACALVEWFQSKYKTFPVMDEKHKKNTLSILELVIKKVKRTLINKAGKEQFNMSLKYHEAYAVWSVLVNVENNFDSQQILNQLDQKIQ